MCGESDGYDGFYEFAPKYYEEAESMPKVPTPVPTNTSTALLERLINDEVNVPDGSPIPPRQDTLERLDLLIRKFNASTFMNNVYFDPGCLTPEEQKKLLGKAMLVFYAPTRNTSQNIPAKQLLEALTKNE